MDIKLTLKNYRCFQDLKPVSFYLQSGFTSFIGTNNSGKSSLLKSLYEFRALFQQGADPKGNLLLKLLSGRGAIDLPNYVHDYDEIFCNLNQRDLELEVTFRNSQPRSDGNDIPIADTISFKFDRKVRAVCSASLFAEGKHIETKTTSLSLQETRLIKDNQVIAELSPILDALKCLAQTLYIGPFRNAINLGATNDYFDIDVGQSFIGKWQVHKTGDVKRIREAIFKITDDIRRIFEFDSFEINSANNNTDLQVFIDGKSYKLSEVGAGLTQFIMVFGNAAMKQPAFILIDEPELNLHPPLQLDFLTALGSYASEGVMFATHSIGLARASADRVYSVRRTRNGIREVYPFESVPRLSEFLGELSFSGYKELGFDKLLLVEGPSEVKTIQQFLRFYRKEHQIVLIPLGGGSLINDTSEVELTEIKRITDNITALVDSERTSENAPISDRILKFAATCQKAGINCHILEYRAIENYLSSRAIKLVKGDSFSALKPYEALSEAAPRWGKSENWKIAREMRREELQNTDLGNFFEQL